MRIASPCPADWNRMTGLGADRHCPTCNHPVVDLTHLQPAVLRARLDAIADTLASGGRVCVRSRLDRDGMLAGSRRVLTGGMAMILAMAMAGCQGEGPEIARDAAPAPPPEAQPIPSMMGEVAIPPVAMGLACEPPPPPVITMGRPELPPEPAPQPR